MDRLAVGLAISRGRRLYHGLPFVVFALDLRDPLGVYLTRLLHHIGDARSVEDLRRRAERRERAPVTVVPSSLSHVAQMMKYLDKEADPGALEGCTAGDLNAVRAFVRGSRVTRGDVSVFLAADDERSVFRFPLHRRGLLDLLHPIDPLLFGLVETGVAANANDYGSDDLGLLDEDDLRAFALRTDATPLPMEKDRGGVKDDKERSAAEVFKRLRDDLYNLPLGIDDLDSIDEGLGMDDDMDDDE